MIPNRTPRKPRAVLPQQLVELAVIMYGSITGQKKTRKNGNKMMPTSSFAKFSMVLCMQPFSTFLLETPWLLKPQFVSEKKPK